MSPEEETLINRNTMKLQDHLYKALKQRDQYKAERDNCLKDINQLRKALIKKQNLADELMEYQVKYINLTNHIRLKAENNPGVSRYIDLVNYIDRLERD
ncbi:hypothetical protein [Staphylococcus pseudoxylosus]|uniref:hypothetical protein n=1 Tax=Staphylococcus pseudoxylosus TaxID=2282419 RepID=UPI002DB8B85D|nr:hypothetical protein [Staphylococcus pseudoxylosus]MEB6037966.1 hypothetical protein [Staphylococcus pseudoxylosus]